MDNRLNQILARVKKEAESIFGEKLVDVILYGSYARGDYDHESDIDIMVKVNIDRHDLYEYSKKMWKVAHELDLEHDALISVKLQDNFIFEEYKDVLPFYKNVTQEGIRVHAQ